MKINKLAKYLWQTIVLMLMKIHLHQQMQKLNSKKESMFFTQTKELFTLLRMVESEFSLK